MEELVRKLFDATNIKEIIMSASWLDGRPPILVYVALVNPPNTVYKVKWGGGVDIVYSKRGNPGKWVRVFWDLDDGIYKLIGIVDPSILCLDDQSVSAQQTAWPQPSQEPPPIGPSPLQQDSSQEQLSTKPTPPLKTMEQ